MHTNSHTQFPFKLLIVHTTWFWTGTGQIPYQVVGLRLTQILLIESLFRFHPSIHYLYPLIPGQGWGRCWNLSQHTLGERQEYTQDSFPVYRCLFRFQSYFLKTIFTLSRFRLLQNILDNNDISCLFLHSDKKAPSYNIQTKWCQNQTTIQMNFS